MTGPHPPLREHRSPHTRGHDRAINDSTCNVTGRAPAGCSHGPDSQSPRDASPSATNRPRDRRSGRRGGDRQCGRGQTAVRRAAGVEFVSAHGVGGRHMLVSRVAITDKRSGCASLHLVLRIASCRCHVKSSTWGRLTSEGEDALVRTQIRCPRPVVRSLKKALLTDRLVFRSLVRQTSGSRVLYELSRAQLSRSRHSPGPGAGSAHRIWGMVWHTNIY